MTQLLDVRKTLTVRLPSYPDVEVEVYDGLLTHQVMSLDGLSSDTERGVKTLESLIKSWSFVGKDEKPLSVTIDNLKLLPIKDFSFLMNTVTEIMTAADEKKRNESKK